MAPLSPAVDTVVPDPLELGSGFYDPETTPDGLTFRWTGPHASLTFPYAANLGRYLHISMRLAATRAAGQAPADVTLSLNARPQARFTVLGDFHVYQFSLDTYHTPNPYLDPAHLQVDIQSSTVTYPNDPRQLGVAVDWIQVRAEQDAGEAILEGTVWAIALLALLLVATSRFSIPWSLLYGLAALLSFALIHATPVPQAIPITVEVALAGLAWLIAACLAPTQRPAWGLGLAVCGLWLVVAGRLLGDWQIDDAYITYRYAWNLAHGNGLVYNPGQAPVEGYTTFLWTLLAAAALAVGLPPAGVTLAANIALALGSVGLTYHLSARLSARPYPWPLLAALSLSVDVTLLCYGARGSGMEMAAFAFFVLLAVTLLWSSRDQSRDWAFAGLCLALASLTRPEGLLVAPVLLAIKAWQRRRPVGASAVGASQAGRLPWVPRAALVAFLSIVGPYQAWRIAFYGYPFPNTFYAKTGATAALVERGLGYLSSFWSEHWLPATLAALGIILAFRKPQRAGALLAALYLADALTLEEPDQPLAQHMTLQSAYISRWGSAGLWLRDNTPPQTWTVAKGAGAIAYYSQRRVIDLYGLNDLHIAHLAVANMGQGKPGHEKQDPHYVLDRRPDYILAEWDNNFQPFRPQLKRDYEYLSVRAPTGLNIDWWRLK
jgi:hypothetical protein